MHYWANFSGSFLKKESGEFSFQATMIAIMIVGIILLIVCIFGDHIIAWWYDIWHPFIVGPGSPGVLPPDAEWK